MASSTCKSCLRALRRQSRSIGKSTQFSHQPNFTRPFATSPSRRIELPKPNATPANPIPPVTPSRAPLNKDSEIDPNENHPHSPASEVKKRSKVLNIYSVYTLTEQLFKECSKHANYTIPEASDDEAEIPKTTAGEDLGKPVEKSWWLDSKGAGLQPTFSSWSQVTMLHMWLFIVRFRAFAATETSQRSAKEIAQEYQQNLTDHFFYDAEDKMAVYHNMSTSGTRNKYLKDLFVQWRGCLAAYDEALIKGDAVLAAAVWRNVFKANEEVDVKKLAMIVSFVRRSLRGLGAINDEKLRENVVRFGNLAAEEDVVAITSKSMTEIPVVNEKVEKKNSRAERP